ncbi:unnamed protein product [Sympodiomycopsis kandeliae]
MAAVQKQPQTPQGSSKKAQKNVQQPVEDTTSQASSEVESEAEDAESTTAQAQEAGAGQTEDQNKESAEGAEGEEEQPAENSEEEQQKKQDAELANKISDLISTCLDRVKPQLKMITEALDKGDRERQNDELDEQKLVDHVKPLIQQAADTLGECHGGIKALDPDGKLAKRAQSKTSERNATPEEYRLGDLLKELSEKVENTIEESKRRIQDMPKAKKDLGPMLDILRDPLVQILAGVGVLLNGVLNLLGGLLGRLGLGGLVDSIKKILPIDKILGSMGMKI